MSALEQFRENREKTHAFAKRVRDLGFRVGVHLTAPQGVIYGEDGSAVKFSFSAHNERLTPFGNKPDLWHRPSDLVDANVVMDALALGTPVNSRWLRAATIPYKMVV